MGLFGKNPNEVAYTGGKKHWADVIKNTGPGELLIWRQPEEDFNTNSTLIVMPGEEAIFIKGGTVEQVFENGTYKLSTENYPFISRLRNAFTGGISTFNCVVYFVRKADSQEIRWGTETPIQVRDKVWGIRTDARVRGAYKVRIENPVTFLEKLIGNNIPFQLQGELVNMGMDYCFYGHVPSVTDQSTCTSQGRKWATPVRKCFVERDQNYTSSCDAGYVIINRPQDYGPQITLNSGCFPLSNKTAKCSAPYTLTGTQCIHTVEPILQ